MKECMQDTEGLNKFAISYERGHMNVKEQNKIG